MGLYYSGHCYYFIVIVVYGFLCQSDGQETSACNKATGRNDFNMLGNSCFYVPPPEDVRDWKDAQSICVGFNGTLATISQQQTLEFLQEHWDIIGNKNYWIGLYANDTQILRNDNQQQRRQAEWKWLDGTPYNYQDGLGWQSDEPRFDDYLGALRRPHWAAESSHKEQNSYICETKLPGDKLPPAQTTTTKMTQPQQPEDNNDQDSSGQSLECGGNWQHNSDTKKCYSLQEATNSITWNEAENQCMLEGGHLACPSTESQHNAVVEIIRQRNVFEQNVWIGLMHETGAGAGGQNRQDGWKWVDDSPYNFKHWETNEPGVNEKVVRLQDGMWKGIGSDEMYKYFLCEKEPTKIPRPNNPQHGGTTEPIFKDTPGAGENDSRVTAKSAGNDNQVPVLGLALGVTFGVAIIALVAAVMFMRTRRSEQFNSMLNRLKIGPSPKKRSDDDSTEFIEQITSNAEVIPTRPVASPSHNVIIPEEENFFQAKQDHRVIPAKPYSENPISFYATVNKTKVDKKPTSIYATVKGYFTITSLPKLKKQESVDATSDRTYENTTISTVIRVEELNDWVKQATASKLIENQYKSLPSSDPKQLKQFCNQEQFKPKNRYRNLVPYDSNRVELSLLPNEPYSHYINASYINAYKRKKAFIAAQGPTVQTVKDFWRMIWEKSVRTVVMVSNQIETNTAKMNFVQYWPKGKEKEAFGDVSVSLKKVENLPNYIVRHMSISKGGDIKIVKQFFFKAWPDHGVPKHAMALINFRDKIRKEMSKGKDPVLVHCSAGVGRTGTFIAIDYLLEQAAKEGVVDFVSCLRKLREQRTDMIQKLIQYQFLIRAVLEAITLGQTAIPSAQFVSTVQTFRDPLTDGETRMQKQFEMLAHYFTEENSSDESAPGKLPENINKNRNHEVLPASSKRVLLMTPVSGKNDYINAVFVEGHGRKSAYMATHAPLHDTIIDLWRAVFDYNSSVIVMLCPKYYLKTEEVYYPEGLGEKMDIFPFEVECLEEDEHIGVRRSQLSLKYCGLEKQVLHFSLTEDLSAMNLEEKMSTIFHIYENAKKWQQQQTEKKAPVTVHCLEGTEWTGLYCTLSNLFDQMNEEQEVDVFHAVGQLRLARTQFVSTLKQYELIYDILALYIDQFNMYSNFQ